MQVLNALQIYLISLGNIILSLQNHYFQYTRLNHSSLCFSNKVSFRENSVIGTQNHYFECHWGILVFGMINLTKTVDVPSKYHTSDA